MTQVTIKFEVPSEIYDQYEGTLQEFLNYLSDLNINNIEVMEGICTIDLYCPINSITAKLDRCERVCEHYSYCQHVAEMNEN